MPDLDKEDVEVEMSVMKKATAYIEMDKCVAHWHKSEVMIQGEMLGVK